MNNELTEAERQAFSAIEDQLRIEFDRTDPQRTRTILWSLSIAAGSILCLLGLVIDVVVLSFAGFVVLLVGTERFSRMPVATRWGDHLRVRAGLLPAGEVRPDA